MRKFGMTPGEVGAGLGTAMVLGSVGGLILAGAAAKAMKSRWGVMTPVRVSQIGYSLYALIIPLYLFARTPTEIFVIATIQMRSEERRVGKECVRTLRSRCSPYP